MKQLFGVGRASYRAGPGVGYYRGVVMLDIVSKFLPGGYVAIGVVFVSLVIMIAIGYWMSR